MKNKIKKKSSIKKRVFLTANGKVKKWSTNTSHLMRKKTPKSKRHLRKHSYLSPSDFKRIKSII
ncbi:MAG TPA: 50S ribosomal protein L35 [Mycoplasmatales bacterium]|nr:50S ribosomal protein L35 [Mycoplasmatales bacterium]